MTSRSPILCAVTLLLLAAAPASAQLADEPHFSHLTRETVRAAPPAPRPVQGALAARATPRSSGLQVALNAEGGYAYYHGLTLDEVNFHGPVVQLSLDVTWDTSPIRVGMRIHGVVGPNMTGDYQPFLASGDGGPGEGTLWGVYLGAIARTRGFWGSVGVGLTSIMDLQYLPTASSPTANEGADIYLPELFLAGGYELMFQDHLGLRLGVEVGTFFFLTWRVTGTLGILARF